MKKETRCNQCGAPAAEAAGSCPHCGGSDEPKVPPAVTGPSPPLTRPEAAATSSFAPDLRGRLGDKPIAEAIREANIHRKTGILHLERQGLSKRIYFSQGSIIFANSDSDSDRLGQFLMRSGKIDDAICKIALQAMKQTGQRFGRTVVELGVMSEESMTVLVAQQVREIITSLFEWDSGYFGFEQVERPVEDDVVVDLSMADIMLTGVRRMNDAVDFRGALRDLNRVVRYSDKALLLNEKTTLSPEEGFVLSRVDGTSTISEIVAVSPLSEEKTLRCIYGLMLTGVLETERKAERKAKTDKKAETAPRAQKSQPVVREPEKKEETVPPFPQAQPAPAAPEFSEEEKALAKEITSKLASFNGATLYEILEVSRGASDAEIKSAYYALAKKYHPDRHHFRPLPAAREHLEALFLKITQAYQVLSASGERRRYDGKLQQTARVTRTESKPAPSKTTPEPGQPKAPVAMAGRWFQKGKDHYYKMSYYDAVQCLREAVRLDPQESSYRKLLARALAKNPRWRREAESHYQHALKEDQFDLECYLGLAEIYEASSMSSRALKMYKAVLGFDPDNKTARAKVFGEDKETGGFQKLKDFKNMLRRKQD